MEIYNTVKPSVVLKVTDVKSGGCDLKVADDTKRMKR